MKVKWLPAGVVLTMMTLLCGILLAGCPTGGEDDANAETVAGADLTGLIALPATGSAIPTAIAEQPQFTGTITWKDSYNGDTFLDNVGTLFNPNAIYRAAVRLTAKPGYTFKGTGENSFVHQKGAAANPAGTGSSLTVTILFPKTPKVDDVLVSATDLTTLVYMPSRGGAPQTAVDQGEYSGTISWETEAGETLEGNFAPDTVYRAVIALSPKEGYTFSGLSGDSFAHTGGQAITFNVTAATVIILFDRTAKADEEEKVTLFDLTGLISVPVHRAEPETDLDAEQYTGTAAWYYTEASDTPVGGTFDYGKPIKAVLTLTAKEGFTLTGLPVNAFTHSGSTGASNAAGSGVITISFAAASWKPAAISYPSLDSGKSIKICCYPSSGSSGTRLLSNSTLTDGSSASNYWDYGYNGTAANNLSDWEDILKNAEGVTFDGDECGHGHPTVFLAGSVPEALRKRAHCFTLDLGEVTSGIVQFGMYPRTNESESERGYRWPIQFEVFYSDSEIGPIPGDGATSLGVFDWGPIPNPFAWRYVDLYTRTSDGKGISARYIHVRIYAEGKNGVNSEWVAPSFAGIRVGIEAES